MTVFLAAPGLAAHLEHDWVPARGPLAVDMRSLSDGGSVIIADTVGRIPGLRGRFAPRRDAHDRTYAYATDISIDEGRAQPVHFVLGEELPLTDAAGHEAMVASSTSVAGRHWWSTGPSNHDLLPVESRGLATLRANALRRQTATSGKMRAGFKESRRTSGLQARWQRR